MIVRPHTSLIAICILSMTLLLTACEGEEAVPDVDTDVTQDADTGVDGGNSGVEMTAQDNTFSPGSITVTAGAEVVAQFTNNGSNPHTFTSDALDFDTGTVDPGGTATVTFEASAGTAEFFCSIHAGSGMTGTIVAE